MAISSSCQFYGIDAVIRAYTNRGVAPWAIWHNRQFMFKYEGKNILEGETELRATLQAISGSVATYTLCVYENPPGGKVKSKTENDGSFNFILNQRENLPSYQNNSEMLQLLREIKQNQTEIDLRLSALESDEDDEPDQVGNIVAGIKQIMEVPGVPALVGGFLGKLFPSGGVAAIAGVNDPGAAEGCERDFLAAREKILQRWPDFDDVVFFLAEKAENDPGGFASLVSMVKTFVK